MQGRNLVGAACISLLTLGACAQTEFFDDFEDGSVNPAYQFVVGDALSVLEGDPCENWGECLQMKSNAYFFLPHITGNPEWVTTQITPGVVIELDVIQVGASSTVELGVADSINNIQDYFALKVEIDPATSESKFICYDETERISLEGSLFFPLHMSFTVDQSGTAYGSIADGISEIECPLHTAVSCDTLAPAIVMWSFEEDGLAWVDNFHVELQ
jgi:hypothetical protein